jgi:hypothetical protein
MKTIGKLILAGATGVLLILLTPGFKSENKNPLDHQHAEICGYGKGCTFKTLFGEESSDGHNQYKSPAEVQRALASGLQFLSSARQNDGGWGAGSHYNQNIRDPHAVSTDPATTAMVGMAFLRSGSTLKSGQYAGQIRSSLEYLLKAVESTPKNQLKITKLSNTQIQTKLGDNIDAVLAAQFFNNILELKDLDAQTEKRVRSALAECVLRIQQNQASDGSLQGDGWAGVLQSSLASNVLEASDENGIAVDRRALERSRDFQKKNYDAGSGKVNTERGAGIVLYSVSGSVRASAKEAREAEVVLQEAAKAGKVKANAPVTQETLQKAGLSQDQAAKLATSYNVYQSAKSTAQRDDVMSGFGNNGGEEFLSFLQTGESLVIGGGNDWKKWYDDMAGRIVHIQEENGSWNGHHCITSPVFCTATCLLILSIDRDIERLRKG